MPEEIEGQNRKHVWFLIFCIALVILCAAAAALVIWLANRESVSVPPTQPSSQISTEATIPTTLPTDPTTEPTTVPTEPPVEKKVLCLGAAGAKEDFFSLKGSIEAFASANDLTFTYQRAEVPYLHPGRTAEIYCQGVKVGHFGQLRYEVVDSLNIAAGKKADTRIFLAELDYSVLCTLFKEGIKYTPEKKEKEEKEA